MDKLLSGKLKTHQTIFLIGAFLTFSTLLVGFLLFKPSLKLTVGSQKALKPGNEMRDFYLKLPVPLDFRVYFFNITNPAEVKEGKKPIVQEVGPYCYDAYKEKIDVVDDKDTDTLTYTPYEIYVYNDTRTGELSEDDEVTILNPLVVGIVNAVADSKPQFLKAVNKAIPIIFKENSDIYITVKVREILFDGVLIDCRVNDFSATAVCSQFKAQSAMVEVEKNVYKFSLFGNRNGTLPSRVTVNRGIKAPKDLGKVVSINNKSDLGVWPDKQCNSYHGTDGWIFPSFLKKEEGIWSVTSDLCRSVQAKYVEDLKFHGVAVRKYYATLGDMSSNPEEKCFCPTPETCLPKGVMDLTKCVQVPLYCTLPHFLEVDEKVREQVEGLHPDTEKHMILIIFDPIVGTPMLGQRRIQLNLKLRPIKKISFMQTVPEALHPILWLEEGIELKGYLLKRITTAATLLKVAKGFRYVVLIIGLELMAYGGYKMFREWQLLKVAPVPSPSKAENKGETNDFQSNQDAARSDTNETELAEESQKY